MKKLAFSIGFAFMAMLAVFNLAAAEPAKDQVPPVKEEISFPSPALEAKFRQVPPGEMPGNIIKRIGSDWMLITAGSPQKFNTMTASWGGTGVMWGKPVAFILVRNTRYTFGFLEKEQYFTLTFYDNKHRQVLKMFGTKSGRDTDKVKESGFIPLDTGCGMAYEEADMIIICKKMYSDPLHSEGAADPEQVKKLAATKDYHKLYFGEILGVWLKK